jgi:HTH-type transcriptional regulator/antitoxin MqsA
MERAKKDTVELTGGGVNAFSRYENGKAKPVPAVINLFRLLDKHPELMEEIAG